MNTQKCDKSLFYIVWLFEQNNDEGWEAESTMDESFFMIIYIHIYIILTLKSVINLLLLSKNSSEPWYLVNFIIEINAL